MHACAEGLPTEKLHNMLRGRCGGLVLCPLFVSFGLDVGCPGYSSSWTGAITELEKFLFELRCVNSREVHAAEDDVCWFGGCGGLGMTRLSMWLTGFGWEFSRLVSGESNAPW